MPSYEPVDIRTFKDWVSGVDVAMKEKFGIDTTDAGLDSDQLHNYWKWEDSPTDFVDWFGEKYDLTPISDWGWHNVKSKL